MESQVKQEHPQPPADHPVNTNWKGWYPGKAGIATERGYQPGVAFKEFTAEARGDKTVNADTVANEWFAANPGLLICDIKYANRTILVAYTKILDAQEHEDQDSLLREARELKDKREAENKAREEKFAEAAREAEKKAAEKAAADEKELRRLADLGRRHEKNCSKKEKHS